MGLDFDGSNAHWSYSGFHVFRIRLAELIGIDLETMEGFSGTHPWSTVNDDIVPLLYHSDCDGEMSPDECAKVGPRLLELVGQWPEDDYDREKATVLGNDMIHCGKSGIPLVFC